MSVEHPSKSKSPRLRFGSRFAALAVALLLVLAACSGDDSTDTTASGGSDTPGTTAAGSDTTAPPSGGDEPVELIMWFNGETVPPDNFASLEAEHNIKVSWDIRGDDILPLTLQMLDAGERLPDIIEIDTNTVPAYIEAGVLLPMDDLVAQWESEDPDLYADVFPSAWENGTFDGVLYHMANKAGDDIIYYNIDMLEEAGIEVPLETWDDVADAALELKGVFPGLSEYFGTGGTSPDRMFYWSYGFGVPFIGQQGNIPDLSSPQGLEMIEWLDRIFKEGLVNPSFMIGDQDESQGAFIRDDLPILMEGANGGISFIEAGFEYGTDFGTFALPQQAGGESMNVPRGLSIVAETEHPYEASLVLRYMSELEQTIPRFTVLLSSPIRSFALFESDELAERLAYYNTPEIIAHLQATVNQIPPGTNTFPIGDVLKELLDELTVVGTDEAYEDLAARYMDELLALD